MCALRIGVVDQGTDKVAHYVDPLVELGASVEVLRWRILRPQEVDVRAFDGLVLCGGDDIDGCHFGEPTHPSAVLDPTERDLFEIEMVRRSVALALPVLAVCRGAQILNVALGGGLEQHIPDIPGRGEHGGGVIHPVEMAPGSRLRGLVGAPSVQVNSFHHQAVGRPAPGIEVAALAPDGCVEAVEVPGFFCLGVQWHPERAGCDPRAGLALFRALSEAAGDARTRVSA